MGHPARSHAHNSGDLEAAHLCITGGATSAGVRQGAQEEHKGSKQGPAGTPCRLLRRDLDVGIGPSDKRHGRQAHSHPCGYTYLDPQQPRGAHAVTSNVTLHVHLPSYLQSAAISAAIFAFCRHFFCFLSLFLISVVKSAVCRKICRPICVLSP